MHFRFESPWLLLFGLLAFLPLLWRPRRGGSEFAGFALARLALRRSRRPWLLRLLVAVALAALALAAARPQYGREVVTRSQDGRDLILVIDLSYSMTVDDIIDHGVRRDRLAAVMDAAKRFVAGRPNDRVGLVFFASSALLSCPPTYDTHTLTDFLDRTERQQRELWRRNEDSSTEKGLLGDGTNLGLGLGTALRALQDPRSKGRALILVTDGKDSHELPGWVDPLAAARHAATLGVRIHGIGVGDPQGTMTRPEPFTGRVRLVRVAGNLMPDLARLHEITGLADGMAFAANDAAALEAVFRRIDGLEPTPQTVTTREDYADRFFPLLAFAVACLALAILVEPWMRGVA